MQTVSRKLSQPETHLHPARFLLIVTVTLVLVCFAASCSQKRSTSTRVTVAGEATLKAQPDAAVIVLSVVTQSPQALTAQQENARKSDAVLNAAKGAAGKDPEIKTSDYSLQPQYDYRDNQLPKIIGYEARNTVSITMSDLNGVGRVIDAASRAGTNSVERIAFILRENSPARGQALATATEQAMGKAQSIAQAMGGRVIHLVEEQESAPTVSPSMMAETYGEMSLGKERDRRPTPIEAGALNVSSRVQLIVEIEARL